MNFIAHAFFSKAFDRYMLGQLLGDFSTRHALIGSHEEFHRGVRGHRSLDEFTDGHESFIAGCKILEPASKRYAPVVMDIVLDFYLVKNWSQLSDEGEFDEFLDELYETINHLGDELPDRMQKPAKRMSDVDWFSIFGSMAGLERVLYYTSKRVRYPDWMNASTSWVAENEATLEPLCVDLLSDQRLRTFRSDVF